MSEKNKTRAYLEGVRKLHELIEKEYEDGGWLPPGREMCERLGLSHLTYRKAVNRLVDERTAVSYPRKGHYIIAAHLRTPKVGVVLRNAEEQPHFAGCSLLFSALERLEKANFQIQQIQASPVTTLINKAHSHAVHGLLWFYPPTPILPLIEQIHASQSTPVVVVFLYDLIGKETPLPSFPSVRIDVHHLARVQADYLLSRGHRKIAYIGNFESAEYTGLAGELVKGGLSFSPSHCVDDTNEIHQRLPMLIKNEGITAILSEGGNERFDMVFQVLSQFPVAKQPELLMRHDKPLEMLRKKYPQVEKATAGHVDHAKIGSIAGEMLARHIKYGEPLTTKQVQAYSIG